jgi:hypothetical protein
MEANVVVADNDCFFPVESFPPDLLPRFLVVMPAEFFLFY